MSILLTPSVGKPRSTSIAAYPVGGEATVHVNRAHPVGGEAAPDVNRGHPVGGEAAPDVNRAYPVGGEAEIVDVLGFPAAWLRTDGRCWSLARPVPSLSDSRMTPASSRLRFPW